ncbi:MAG: hypothetical protein KJZ83_14860 [Burkholderiaceae bacterium]|nr:hypothetical protein [Burkholderiaceae bacterium]
MKPSITGQRSELGRLLSQQTARGNVRINVAGQQANTLLHDGHAWKDFARTMRTGTRRAMRSDAGFLVHASFAFVLGHPEKDPLRSLAGTILECEELVLSGPIPACVVRLGYLYGPQSKDLRAYRKAFRLGRPYWAGSRAAGQFHLHHDDAVSALLAAAVPGNAGRRFHATSGPPVAFVEFMDHFARLLGTRSPRHAPRIAAPLFRLVVREEHMQQADLAMPQRAPSPRVPGWRPSWPDYRKGLLNVVEAWKA